MRLHTNKLDYADLRAAVADAREDGLVADSVYLSTCDEHMSRTHARAFDVSLASDDKVKGDGRRRPNLGRNKDRTEYWAATYDEWGWFLAAVFAKDPTVTCTGHYRNAEHFHIMTNGNYQRQSTDA